MMHRTRVSFAILLLVGTTTAAGQSPPKSESSGGLPPRARNAASRRCRRHDARTSRPGFRLLRPYERGKVPVVFVHGLWSNPCSWSRMIEALEADPALRDRYQFWTFGYSTGDPLPYSASLMRNDLDEARRKFDPESFGPGV